MGHRSPRIGRGEMGVEIGRLNMVELGRRPTL